MNPRETRIEEYDFELPADKIPEFPLPERDASRLLLFQNGQCDHRKFLELPDILRAHDLLIFNNTKVIPARLIFQKETGAHVEVFCLEPQSGSHQDAMMQRGRATWKCFVGGSKKWKKGQVIYIESQTPSGADFRMEAVRGEGEEGSFTISFSWTPSDLTFSQVLEQIGKIPLPPYIKREASAMDVERYQTILAKKLGSVAAPTAALHFTDHVLNRLKEKGIQMNEVTLHVGAGTFKPVSTETLGDHDMHAEVIEVHVSVLRQLHERTDGRNIAVGTTSMRTLESLFWMGVKMFHHPNEAADNALVIRQWDPYELTPLSRKEALQNLLRYAEQYDLDTIRITTSILIAPGYAFQMCDGLVTNFHMPKSTLIVLVSAFIGNAWRDVYSAALQHDYRFLSYGDSSLLLP
jgi:S-adenosylmethionine:tRNA ribosyltransferase-isomerase